VLFIFFFFFKQKTAYEIGLGIPAEPLFRSTKLSLLPSLVSWIKHSVDRFVIVSIFIPKLRLILILNSFLGSSDSLVFSELFHSRSEERRVGKECRSRWSTYNYKKSKKRRSI